MGSALRQRCQRVSKVFAYPSALQRALLGAFRFNFASARRATYLRVYLALLRHELEADAARPRFLLTEPGVDYRLETE